MEAAITGMAGVLVPAPHALESARRRSNPDSGRARMHCFVCDGWPEAQAGSISAGALLDQADAQFDANLKQIAEGMKERHLKGVEKITESGFEGSVKIKM